MSVIPSLLYRYGTSCTNPAIINATGTPPEWTNLGDLSILSVTKVPHEKGVT